MPTSKLLERLKSECLERMKVTTRADEMLDEIRDAAGERLHLSNAYAWI